MTDLEISKALALAIGWKKSDMRKSVGKWWVYPIKFAAGYSRPFDYRHWKPDEVVNAEKRKLIADLGGLAMAFAREPKPERTDWQCVLFLTKEIDMDNSKLFNVYHGTNYPHRILQGVTLEQLHAYCAEHGITHQAERDTQRGVRYWDAFVG